MKLTINVECTPVEARQFFGLPDVTPLNELLVNEMSNRVQQNMALMNPDTMMRSWMALGGQAQEAMMGLLTAGAKGALRSGE